MIASYIFYIKGIVRNVDPVRQLLYIQTPESVDVLDRVNVLLKGNVQLPHTFLTEVKGSVSLVFM